MIGNCLRRLPRPPRFFPATKVWTPFQWMGRRQIADSQRLWGVETFSLLQIHMAENMGAARGRLPDAAMRQRMLRYVEGL